MNSFSIYGPPSRQITYISLPDVDDFYGISEEFVASFESVGFSSK